MLRENLSFQPAPNFKKRQKAQVDFEEKAQNGKEYPYVYISGEYPDSIIDRIKSITQKLLEIKECPVVLVDVGGGLGLSWLKLADTFKKEIQDSELALVVSNLKDKPEEIIFTRKLSGNRRAIELSKNRFLVHYINGSFSTLSSKTITLSNGKSINLLNNVDIVHEALSLTAWDFIPEIDIPNVLKLASPYATYLLPEIDASNYQGNDSVQRVNIRKGIKVAHQVLQERLGFTKETTGDIKADDGTPIPDSSYIIFRRPNFPS